MSINILLIILSVAGIQGSCPESYTLYKWNGDNESDVMYLASDVLSGEVLAGVHRKPTFLLRADNYHESVWIFHAKRMETMTRCGEIVKTFYTFNYVIVRAEWKNMKLSSCFVHEKHFVGKTTPSPLIDVSPLGDSSSCSGWLKTHGSSERDGYGHFEG